MTTEPTNALDSGTRAKADIPIAPTPVPLTSSAQPTPLRALVISPDATYRAWAADTLNAAAVRCDVKTLIAVDTSTRATSSALHASGADPGISLKTACNADSNGRLNASPDARAFDIILIDDSALTDDGRALLADFLATHPAAVVIRRCASRLTRNNASAGSRNHRVVRGGVLSELEGEGLNLSTLPVILSFAIERNRANAAARDVNEQLLLVGDLSPSAILIVDDDGIPCYTNGIYRRMTGMAHEPPESRQCWYSAVHADDRKRVEVAWHTAARRREHLSITFRLLHPDGQALRVRARGRVLPVYPGTRERPLMAFSMNQHPSVTSITTLRAAEQALYDEKEHSRLLLEAIDEAVVLTDGAGRITVFNPMAEALTGYRKNDALGQPLASVVRLADAGTREPIASLVADTLEDANEERRNLDCLLIARDGSEHQIESLTVPVRDQAGLVDGALLVFHDQLQSRVVAEHMAYLAYHDVVTGLPNRALLTERLTQAIRLAQRNGTMLALVFIDIDDFKLINDSLGHDAGDELLVMAAHRLQSCVRTTDTIARYGGDEYVALLAEVDRPEDALHVAEKMTAAMHRSFNLDGHTVRVGMSAGTSVYPFDGRNAKSLLEKADQAMYEAKRRNKTATSVT